MSNDTGVDSSATPNTKCCQHGMLQLVLLAIQWCVYDRAQHALKNNYLNVETTGSVQKNIQTRLHF